MSEETLTLREELAEQMNSAEEVPETEVEEVEQVEDVEEVVDDVIVEDQEDDPSGDNEVAEEVEVIQAPQHWAADDRDLFNGQSEDVKSYMLRRHNDMESNYTKKTQELAEQRKSVEPFNSFVEKWTPHTTDLGVPLVTGLESLLENDRVLRSGTPEQKQQIALQLLSSYGIDLNSSQEDEYIDPQYKAMQDQINTLNSNLVARDKQDQSTVAEKQAAAVKSNQLVIDAFKAEKEGDSLKHAHFDTLEADITVLFQSGQVGEGDFKSQLDAAYNKAVWMNPTTREQLLNKQQSSSKEKQIKEQSKAAAQAKKSAKVNKRGTNTKVSTPKNLSLREELILQMKEANINT